VTARWVIHSPRNPPRVSWSERDAAVVAASALVVLVAAVVRGRSRATGLAADGPTTSPTGATAAHSASALGVAAAEELDALDDDLVLGPLAAAVLVFPLVQLQPALDEQRVALLGVLRDQVGQVPLRVRPAERLAVDVQRVGVVLPLPGLRVLPAAADREAE